MLNNRTTEEHLTFTKYVYVCSEVLQKWGTDECKAMVCTNVVKTRWINGQVLVAVIVNPKARVTTVQWPWIRPTARVATVQWSWIRPTTRVATVRWSSIRMHVLLQSARIKDSHITPRFRRISAYFNEFLNEEKAETL